MNSLNRLSSVIAISAVVSGVIFFTAAFARFGQNDFMYGTAPIFWGALTLYEDLMFVQAPGSIYIYGLLYDLVGPTDFYTILRVFSLSVLLFASLLTYRVSLVLAGPVPAALALLFLFTSHFVASIGLDSGSTPLALLFVLGAFYIYSAQPISVRSAAAIGLMIGLAASMKLNFALYAVPFGLFLACRRGFGSREVASYVASGIIGSSIIWYYLLADFSQFWFFNIRFHALMNVYREASGENLTWLVLVAALLFLLYASPVLYLCRKAAQKAGSSDEQRQFLELGVLLLTSLVAAFAPLYYAPQYMAAPVFFLSICFALALKKLSREEGAAQKKAWKIGIAIGSIWIVASWVQTLPSSFRGLAWHDSAPAQMRQIRDRIDRFAALYLNDTACRMTAVSLSPLPLIGSKFDISQVSTSGPFLPMVTRQLEEHALEFAHHGLTFEDLHELRPAAFLVGYYPDVEAERMLVRYAHENNYIAHDVGTLSGYRRELPLIKMRLLLRQECMGTP